MELSSYKIDCPRGAELERVGADSVRIIKYLVEQSDRELIEFKKSGWGSVSSPTYEFKVNLPDVRKVEYVIIIQRSSANNYKIAYSSAKSAVFENVKTYDEVNDFIKTHTK